MSIGLARVAYASYLVKVNVQVTFRSNFQMCHRLKVDKNSSYDWPAIFSHVTKL